MNRVLTSVIFLFTLIIAQTTSYRFDYFDISNGLSQNQANAIYQAQDGYIYVGSQGGLDRFDGYDFKYFSHNPTDTTSIPYGWVNAIAEDSRNRLWIGTNQKNIGYLKSDGSWTSIKLKGMESWDRDGRAWWWGFISDIKPYQDKVIVSSNGNGLFIVGDNYEKHYASDQKEINVITEIFVVNKLSCLSLKFIFRVQNSTGSKSSISCSLSVINFKATDWTLPADFDPGSFVHKIGDILNPTK